MWKSIGCEVQGRGHKKADVPCQDKTLTLNRNGVHSIALADGAGSAKLSHYGAEQVVHCITEYLVNNFVDLINSEDGKQVKRQILETVLNSLESVTLQHECTINDLASTLLAVTVSETHYLIAHIGDGVIGYLHGEELKVASLPQNGEYTNETTFVTSKDALASMRLFKGEIKDIAGFILMSDGTEQSLYHKSTKSLAKVVIKLMQRTCLLNMQGMEEQLLTALESVIARNTQDDCSIALLVRPVGILHDYFHLDIEEKCDLVGLQIQAINTRKRLNWYDDMINMLETPCNLKKIARQMHLKPKYTKKRLDILIERGLVTKCGANYIRAN